MIKKLAKYILKDELADNERLLDRQDEIIHAMLEDEQELPVRGYVFDIDMLGQDDRDLLGKFYDHPVIEVLKKSFKVKADENCDKLIHFQEESEFKRAQWALAVRIYDDLIIQLKTLSRTK